MPDQLLAGDRMLALGQPFELVFTHVAGEPPPLGELAVPDAANHIAGAAAVLAVADANAYDLEAGRARRYHAEEFQNARDNYYTEGGRRGLLASRSRAATAVR